MAGAFLISAAEGIVESLLSQAKDLISNKINNQINLASSFTEDLEDLSQTLEIIHALLHDADQNRKKTSATMLVWLKNLKAVICDAEDLLDELAYEALRRKIEVQDSMMNKVRNVISLSNPISFRLEMAEKIKDINTRTTRKVIICEEILVRKIKFVSNCVFFVRKIIFRH